MSKIRRVDFYPDEFLIGITGMTAEEIGVYWVICSLIYSSGGPIPMDDPRILRCGGASSRRWPAIRRSLFASGKLVETEDGRLSNRRCEKELSDAQRRVQRASDVGKTGGRPRKLAANSGETPAEVPFLEAVQQEFGERSPGVRGEFSGPESLKNNDLVKGSGFSDEKLTITITTNHQDSTPVGPPSGGTPPDGGTTDRDLPGDAHAGTPRRKHGGEGVGRRGTRVQEGDLPEEWAVAANHSRERHALPPLSRGVLRLRWDAFVNYWRGRPGSKALKADWRATWLNDCLDPRTEQRFPATAVQQSKRPAMIDTTG